MDSDGNKMPSRDAASIVPTLFEQIWQVPFTILTSWFDAWAEIMGAAGGVPPTHHELHHPHSLEDFVKAEGDHLLFA